MPLTWTLEMVMTVSFVLSFYQKQQKQKNRPRGLGRTMVSQKSVGHSASVPTCAVCAHVCPVCALL